MSLLELKNPSNKKRKRVGRGNASGHGTYSCRGMKGQSARAGGRRRPGFEGGQTPYLRKMPKIKGFTNPNYVEYQIINVGDLNVFEDKATVNKAALIEKNLISKKNLPVKLLAGKGELEKSITIEVDKASLQAIKKVESSKGKVVLPKEAKAPKAKKEDAPKEETAETEKEA